MRKIRASRLLACVLAPLAAPALASSEAALPVVAVLSSQTGPYREALAGLESELGAAVESFVLSQGEPKIHRETRVVVAFGSKAALLGYPSQATLVYAMAPGTAINIPNAVKICMEPDADVLLASLRQIQPDLRRLGVLWQSPRFEGYVQQLREAAAPLNLVVEDARLANSADVPDHLRAIHGKVDALWLPPDPLLLNADSLAVLMEFSRASRIPLFVPSAGLVAQGATASAGPSFREIGRLAAVAVRKTLEGRRPERDLHSVRIELFINKSAAAQAGLKIPEETLQKADKVIP